jgi:hypothetical protein
MKIRENLEFDRVFQEDYEPDWRYMSWWCNKVGFIQSARDVDPTCNAELIDGQVYHALMAQTVESQCSPQVHETALDYNFVELNETVKKTLRLLRLFAFS